MSRELTLRCEDSLDGIFTAIYDAFVYKNQMERPYTDSIKIAIGEGNLTLFSTDLTVATDPIKVEKTVTIIRHRRTLHCHSNTELLPQKYLFAQCP